MKSISAEQLNQDLVSLDWPYFDNISIDEQTVKYDITVKPELSYLAGHFPQQPVVPGVVQIHWAGELSKQFFSCVGFSSLKKVKFSNPILPESSLELILNYKKSVNQVNFDYVDDQQVYSSGVISFL